MTYLGQCFPAQRPSLAMLATEAGRLQLAEEMGRQSVLETLSAALNAKKVTQEDDDNG